MRDCWQKLLAEFFELHAKALGEIFDAMGCREGWLQGELFRWFRFHGGFDTFAVNSLQIGNSKKADFSAESPTRVVGEIKLLGYDYQPKTITGGSIKPFLNRIDQPITAADRSIILGWGLIQDFFRLLDFAAQEKRDALLVLVIDERSQRDLSLARALRGINFVRPSTDIRFPAGVVRIWSVGVGTAVAEPEP